MIFSVLKCQHLARIMEIYLECSSPKGNICLSWISHMISRRNKYSVYSVYYIRINCLNHVSSTSFLYRICNTQYISGIVLYMIARCKAQRVIVGRTIHTVLSICIINFLRKCWHLSVYVTKNERALFLSTRKKLCQFFGSRFPLNTTHFSFFSLASCSIHYFGIYVSISNYINYLYNIRLFLES